MAHYIHHVPGRLRVKTLAIKRNETQAQSAKAYLDRMEGVQDTEVNTVTGSIVVRYDASLLNCATILSAMHSKGLVTQSTMHHHGGITDNGADFGQKLSDTVIHKVMETVFERSALALVAALI